MLLRCHFLHWQMWYLLMCNDMHGESLRLRVRKYIIKYDCHVRRNLVEIDPVQCSPICEVCNSTCSRRPSGTISSRTCDWVNRLVLRNVWGYNLEGTTWAHGAGRTLLCLDTLQSLRLFDMHLHVPQLEIALVSCHDRSR